MPVQIRFFYLNLIQTSIPGIGSKRKEQLLKTFKSLTAIRQATLPELERLLPKDAASAVYHHFHNGSAQDTNE